MIIAGCVILFKENGQNGSAAQKEKAMWVGIAACLDVVIATALLTLGLVGPDISMPHSGCLGCCIAGFAYMAIVPLLFGLGMLIVES